MRSVVVTQPMLFPWPGFFEHLMVADIILFLDDAQFSKGSFTNRVQLRFGGESKWMTIPLAQKGTFLKINELREAEAGWRRAHVDMLRQSLQRTPYLNDALALAEKCYENDAVCDVLIASIELPAQYLGIDLRQRMRTSAMNVGGASWQRVLDLVRQVDGDRYVTGHGAARYLNHEAFESAGIAVEYMRYSLTAWPRASGSFTPFVSVLDLIANAGPAALGYLAPGTEPWRSFIARTTGMH